jgi:RND family efflux transporter MFP subunit
MLLLLAASPCLAAAPPGTEKFAQARTFLGKVEAPNSTTIRPRISGQVLKVLVKEGQAVKKGDLLFQFDDALPKAELEKAEALSRVAQAKVEMAKARRARVLAGGTSIPKEEVSVAEVAIVTTQEELKVAKANVTIARLNVEFARVRSPIAGRVGRVLARVGDAVRENETQLVHIEALGKPSVMIDVSAKDYIDIFGPMIGKPAADESRKVRVTTATKKQFPGRVVYVEGRLHPSTGTARVRVEVEGKDLGLTPGFSVRVEVPGSKPAGK